MASVKHYEPMTPSTVLEALLKSAYDIVLFTMATGVANTEILNEYGLEQRNQAVVALSTGFGSVVDKEINIETEVKNSKTIFYAKCGEQTHELTPFLKAVSQLKSAKSNRRHAVQGFMAPLKKLFAWLGEVVAEKKAKNLLKECVIALSGPDGEKMVLSAFERVIRNVGKGDFREAAVAAGEGLAKAGADMSKAVREALPRKQAQSDISVA